MQVPAQLLDLPVPPGWEVEGSAPVAITTFAFSCGHVSIGKFERGPVDFIIESHGMFNAPMNCRLGDYDYLNVMTRLIWSDSEIAMATSQALGIPSSVGTIKMETIGQPIVSSHTISWEIDGKTSYFKVERFENDYTDVKTVWRYLWPANNHLGFLEMHWNGVETWLEPTATFGSFSEPMVVAQSGLPIVFGTGGLENGWNPSGEFKFYEGYQCEKELPPPSF